MVANSTVDTKGVESAVLKHTEHEKTHFMGALSCLAHGMSVRPVGIFKSKRRPMEKFPSDGFFHFHENGWMDEEGERLWIDNICKKQPGLANKRSSRVCDSFRSQVADGVKSHLNELRIETTVTPGGLTSNLQPLDARLNKPFRDYGREEWLANSQKSYTACG
ncbi:hypothetical protein M514_25810, partial [Trichuris suis]